jgi:hypothetical protein
VLQQPLRVGGLALVCALATATLAMVTFVVSNLVLSTVAMLGPALATETSSGGGDPVEGVLVSGRTDRTDEQCRPLRRAEVRGPAGLLDRCAGPRAATGASRP